MTKLRSLLLAIGMIAAPVGALAQTPPPPAPVVATPAPAAVTPAPAETPATAAKVEAPAPLVPVAGVGMPVAGTIHLQEQVTPNGREALWIHNVILVPIITIISIFVLLLLFWVVFRYRAARNPVASRTSHNTLIEVIWTLLPVLILLAIAVPSIGLLAAQFKPAGKNALTVKAIGNQWYWTYEYPDNGGFEVVANMLKEPGHTTKGERARTDADGPPLLAVDNRIVLPVGREIKLIVTSNDVIHSWAVPAFWTKMDAVPGRLNEVSFTIEKPGLYFGQCSELCGARHGFMPIAVEAVSPAQYEQWVRSKGGTMPGDKPAAAAADASPAAAPATAEAAPATSDTNQAAPAASDK
jgi:cytochrome c oxidase subunit 2